MAFESEPAGTRTQGPYIKSVLLYQLSYEFNPLRLKRECKNRFFCNSTKMNLILIYDECYELRVLSFVFKLTN